MRRIGYVAAAAVAVVVLALVVGRLVSGGGGAPVTAADEYALREGGARGEAGAIRVQPGTATEPVDSTDSLPAAGAAPAPEPRPAVQPLPAAQRSSGAHPAPSAGPGRGDEASAGGESSSERSLPQEDAVTILRRAADAYADVETISAAFTQRLQNRLLRTDALSRGRLYQRHPDRFLMRFEEPAGDVIVSDGRYFWLYYPSVDSLQVMRAPVGAEGASGVDLRSQFVGDPVARFDATLHGMEAVGGRDAYLLTLVPRQRQGYQRLRVWVDARDYLVRRFEITEENGNVRLIELHDLQINRALADDLFRFTPPPNARIVDRG